MLSLSCWALMSFSLGCPLCISCLAIWLTTATREAWLFISGSRLSNLERKKSFSSHHCIQEQQLWRIMFYSWEMEDVISDHTRVSSICFRSQGTCRISSVFLFSRCGSKWSQLCWVEENKIYWIICLRDCMILKAFNFELL